MHRYKANGLLHHIIDLGKVRFVGRRDDNGLDAVFVGCHALLPQTADGQNPSPQGDLTGHGDIVTNRDISQCRNKRRTGGDPCRRAVLGDCALREVDVDILILIEGILDLILIRNGTDIGDSRRYRLLHHISQGTGGDGLSGAGNHSGFHLQKLSAHGCPCQPVDQPDTILLGNDILDDITGAEIIGQVCRFNGDLPVCIARHHLGSHLTAQRRQTALQRAYTGFPCVVVDDIIDGAVGHTDLLCGKPVAFPLLGQQVPLCNLELFLSGVAGQLDDFHSVQQRRRDRTAVIGGSNKEYMR